MLKDSAVAAAAPVESVVPLAWEALSIVAANSSSPLSAPETNFDRFPRSNIEGVLDIRTIKSQ